MRSPIRVLTSSAVLLLCGLIGAQPARAAWDFIPTASEWQVWTDYCRAQYSWVNSGVEFQFGGTVPAGTVEHWRSVIGDQTFTGMHHWCASIHFLNRARAEQEPKLSNFLMRRASDDAGFSFVRAEPFSPVYPDMAVTLAQIRDALGKPDEAVAALQKGIQAQPKRAEPYVMLAMLYRKSHKLSEARDVLKKADDVTAGGSAEIQYNLGLINFELGDAAAARANARRAYGLGYPLPGLKNMLRKKGQWSAEDDSAVVAFVASLAAAPTKTAAGGAQPPERGAASDDSPTPTAGE